MRKNYIFGGLSMDFNNDYVKYKYFAKCANHKIQQQKNTRPTKSCAFCCVAFSYYKDGGTAAGPIELLIGKQYCFVMMKEKLR